MAKSQPLSFATLATARPDAGSCPQRWTIVLRIYLCLILKLSSVICMPSLILDQQSKPSLSQTFVSQTAGKLQRAIVAPYKFDFSQQDLYNKLQITSNNNKTNSNKNKTSHQRNQHYLSDLFTNSNNNYNNNINNKNNPNNQKFDYNSKENDDDNIIVTSAHERKKLLAGSPLKPTYRPPHHHLQYTPKYSSFESSTTSHKPVVVDSTEFKTLKPNKTKRKNNKYFGDIDKRGYNINHVSSNETFPASDRQSGDIYETSLADKFIYAQIDEQLDKNYQNSSSNVPHYTSNSSTHHQQQQQLVSQNQTTKYNTVDTSNKSNLADYSILANVDGASVLGNSNKQIIFSYSNHRPPPKHLKRPTRAPIKRYGDIGIEKRPSALLIVNDKNSSVRLLQTKSNYGSADRLVPTVKKPPTLITKHDFLTLSEFANFSNSLLTGRQESLNTAPKQAPDSKPTSVPHFQNPSVQMQTVDLTDQDGDSDQQEKIVVQGSVLESQVTDKSNDQSQSSESKSVAVPRPVTLIRAKHKSDNSQHKQQQQLIKESQDIDEGSTDETEGKKSMSLKATQQLRDKRPSLSISKNVNDIVTINTHNSNSRPLIGDQPKHLKLTAADIEELPPPITTIGAHSVRLISKRREKVDEFVLSPSLTVIDNDTFRLPPNTTTVHNNKLIVTNKRGRPQPRRPQPTQFPIYNVVAGMTQWPINSTLTHVHQQNLQHHRPNGSHYGLMPNTSGPALLDAPANPPFGAAHIRFPATPPNQKKPSPAIASDQIMLPSKMNISVANSTTADNPAYPQRLGHLSPERPLASGADHIALSDSLAETLKVGLGANPNANLSVNFSNFAPYNHKSLTTHRPNKHRPMQHITLGGSNNGASVITSDPDQLHEVMSDAIASSHSNTNHQHNNHKYKKRPPGFLSTLTGLIGTGVTASWVSFVTLVKTILVAILVMFLPPVALTAAIVNAVAFG